MTKPTDRSLKKSSKRPVGRPRRDGRPHLTKKLVFETCARLIATNGYSGTGIRLIARELGISTASFFHLFPSKDAMLNELIAWAATPVLTFYDELLALKPPPAVALYKSVLEETAAVARADRDMVSMFYLPELRHKEFEPAQKVRWSLISHYRKLIEAGCDSGVFIPVDSALAADQVLQLTETSIIAEISGTAHSPQTLADNTARLLLRALLTDTSALKQFADAAGTLDVTIGDPPDHV